MVEDVSNISYRKIHFIILVFSCTLTCSQENCTSKTNGKLFWSNINSLNITLEERKMSPYIGCVKAGVFGHKMIDKTAKILTLTLVKYQ